MRAALRLALWAIAALLAVAALILNAIIKGALAGFRYRARPW